MFLSTDQSQGIGGFSNLTKMANLSAPNSTVIIDPESKSSLPPIISQSSLPGNLSIKQLNISSYIVKDSSASVHLRVVNQTVYMLGDPLWVPSIAFANFRDNPTYIKVGAVLQKSVCFKKTV